VSCPELSKTGRNVGMGGVAASCRERLEIDKK